jgi:hypothetical protein
VAPALHSLIIRERDDVADILEFLKHKQNDLRKLILMYCNLGENSTGLLANIVTLCPGLEVLSLDACYPLTSAGYCLIPSLKKLSELYISDCQVDYVYIKLLEHVFAYVKACSRTPLTIHYIY